MRLRSGLVCVLLVAACGAPFTASGGDAGPTDGGSSSEACVPETCAQVGWKCGSTTDGCGHALDCGDCSVVNTSCTADHTACACTALDCLYYKANCGEVPDGCGGTIGCGSCTGEGVMCGGGGTALQCGKGTCTPKTCAELGYDCGVASDGCGAILNCGTCPGNTTCGANKMANVCSCIPEPDPCAYSDGTTLTCGQVKDSCGNVVTCTGATPLHVDDETFLCTVMAGSGSGGGSGGDKSYTYWDCCGAASSSGGSSGMASSSSSGQTGTSSGSSGISSGGLYTCGSGPAPAPTPTMAACQAAPGKASKDGKSATAWCCAAQQ